jgi:hypothetical protein
MSNGKYFMFVDDDDTLLNVDEIYEATLQDVDVITNSFANECFGKLREAISTETFRQKIAFINTNDFIELKLY